MLMFLLLLISKFVNIFFKKFYIGLIILENSQLGITSFPCCSSLGYIEIGCLLSNHVLYVVTCKKIVCLHNPHTVLIRTKTVTTE